MGTYDKTKKSIANILQAIGNSETPGSTAVTVTRKDDAGMVVEARGTTVPSGEAGYALECAFVDTDKTAGTHKLYRNIGTTSSCTFDLEGEIGAADITDESITLADISDNAVLGKLNIYNNTGGTLSAGTLVRVLSYTGTSGVTVEKADADAVKPATHFVPAAINNLATGDIYELGTLTGYNTGGRTIGDAVYLDPTTAGGLTFTAPTGADQVVQQVGTVVTVDASTGSVFLFPGVFGFTKFGTSFHQDGSITPAKQTTAARTRSVVLPFKLPAPTGSNQGPFTVAQFACSQAMTIVGVSLVSDLSTSGSDANNQYQFNPRNITGAANLHTSNTNTQGNELAAGTPKTITVSQNLSFTAGQVFGMNVDIRDDGSAGPTSLANAQLYLILEYTI